MIKSIYTATSGMIVQQKRQENVANNLANAQTTSFKVQDVIASSNRQNNIMKSGEGQAEMIGIMTSGAEIAEIETDYTQGLIENSDRQMDYAIDGNGFFNIEYNGETAFTRNGSFDLDREGYLINSQGHYLIGKNAKTGKNEKIQIDRDTFTIESDGSVIDGSKKTYTIGMSDFLNYDDLENLGDGVYLNNPADGLNREVMADDFQLVSAAKELSNVNVLDEMVKMIEISRAYESNQRVIQSLDEILSKAANDVGSL
jgi:flagellar basal-body rod protein FlgG